MQKTGDRMAEVMEELMARSKQYLETTVAIEETQYNCSKCRDTGSYLVRKKMVTISEVLKWSKTIISFVNAT